MSTSMKELSEKVLESSFMRILKPEVRILELVSLISIIERVQLVEKRNNIT